MIYYSKTTNGFYDSAINKVLPEDAAEISKELHVSLMAEQSVGKQITADSKTGLPVAVDPKTLIDPAELEASRLAALYRAAIGYQNLQVDINLFNELQKSESIVEAGVLLEVDLPLAKACGEWLTALWTDYYTRKADTANSSKDFTNNGEAPHSFAEVRDERKAGLNA